MTDPISRWEAQQRRDERNRRIGQVLAWGVMLLAAGIVVGIAYLFIVVAFASACGAVYPR